MPRVSMLTATGASGTPAPSTGTTASPSTLKPIACTASPSCSASAAAARTTLGGDDDLLGIELDAPATVAPQHQRCRRPTERPSVCGEGDGPHATGSEIEADDAHLIAPDRPFTRYFWMKTNSSTTGMEISTRIANSAPGCDRYMPR